MLHYEFCLLKGEVRIFAYPASFAASTSVWPLQSEVPAGELDLEMRNWRKKPRAESVFAGEGGG